MDWILAITGASLVVGGWLHYLWLIPREAVPERPRRHSAAMAVGLVVGCLAWFGGGGTLATVLLLFVTWPLAALFWWVLDLATLPDGAPTFSVGEALPAFQATRPDGSLFSSDGLEGKRVFLKFYRGHW